MKDISFFNKIYLATTAVDFRKQAHGLALIVEHSLHLNHLSEKSLFVFTNKRKSAIKILYWGGSGYALWWKTLEREKFRWLKSCELTVDIQPRELKWLLEGVDLSTLRRHKKITI